MKEKALLACNAALFCVAVLTLGTMQTSLWYQIFGYFPAPALWLSAVVFVGLYRPLPEAAALIYAFAFLMSTMTVMPMSLIMASAMGVGLAAMFVKRRIYWPGSGYFMIACGLGSLLFHLLRWAGSFAIEDHALTSPEIGDWLLEALLTPLAAPALHALYWAFDHVTGREQPVEASGAQ